MKKRQITDTSPFSLREKLLEQRKIQAKVGNI